MDPTPAPATAHSGTAAPAPRLIVVDDDRGVLDVIERFARPHGFHVSTFERASDALDALAKHPAPAVFVDPSTPGLDGIDAMRAIKQRAPACAVVLMSRHGTIESAVDAIKLGAADYLRKPFDVERLGRMLAALHAESVRRERCAGHEADLDEQPRFHGMVGRSPAMLDLFGLIRRIGPHFTTALVTGETGVGKQLVARALHEASAVASRPFVLLNCAAALESSFEGELLGHVRGAVSSPPGVVCLDEIGELPSGVQARLLRVLESGELRDASAPYDRASDVRIIATTNRVLAHEVQAGRFRSDLYFRLHVVELAVPPLRERREDIMVLANVFVHEFAEAFGKTVRGLTPDAERALVRHDWPGNVRELKNAMGRACMLVEHEWIDTADLRIDAGLTAQAPAGPVRPMQEVEREQVVRALGETNGNKKEAARRLGISRRAFYRRLEKYGLYAPHGEAGVLEDPAA